MGTIDRLCTWGGEAPAPPLCILSWASVLNMFPGNNGEARSPGGGGGVGGGKRAFLLTKHIPVPVNSYVISAAVGIEYRWTFVNLDAES